jgi:hypothetical protein
VKEWPAVRLVDAERVSYWAVTVRTPRGPVDITTVRDAVTEIAAVTWTDPFGPATASLTFPALSLIDCPGDGDLWWWRSGRQVDIDWRSEEDIPLYRHELHWQGYISGESSSMQDKAGKLSMTLKGALWAADNVLAIQEYPTRPWTFEGAISHALERARTSSGQYARMKVEWPIWWTKRYTPDTTRPWQLEPQGFMDEGVENPRWTGMVTRTTGTFSKTLSDYVRSLLASMHTRAGQFSLRVDPGRVPVLFHRDRGTSSSSIIIDLLTPGVAMDVSTDYEAKANVVYGTGTSTSGEKFSNLRFASDGTAFYEPFAFQPAVYPDTPDNVLLRGETLRREIHMPFHEGVDSKDAAAIAGNYIDRFGTAGYAGTITLTTDPYYIDEFGGHGTVLRYTIQAGDTILVRHFQGNADGVVFYVTESSVDVANGVVELTVDTVFRDYITTAEVMQRGRDALTQPLLLMTGQFNPNIEDQLLPWQDDSGYIPSGSKTVFDTFDGMVSVQAGGEFPWTDMTKQYPPSRYPDSYIHIAPAGAWPEGPDSVPTLKGNWSRPEFTSSTGKSQVKLSQHGSAVLMQVMAVDIAGNPLLTPFHLSIYHNRDCSSINMPRVINENYWTHPIMTDVHLGFYPFFYGAFEQVMADGTRPTDQPWRNVADNSQPMVSLGNYYVQAGYYPGDSRHPEDAPTGLLSYENPFGWDFTGFAPWDWTRTYEEKLADGRSPFESVGIGAVMIYSDSEWDPATSALKLRDRDVYFIGRIWHQPPGLS